MHACQGTCTWVGVPGQWGGWSRGLQSEMNVLPGCSRKELKTLVDDGLRSGSGVEMGWLPWNLQKAPTGTKVGALL